VVFAVATGEGLSVKLEEIGEVVHVVAVRETGDAAIGQLLDKLGLHAETLADGDTDCDSTSIDDIAVWGYVLVRLPEVNLSLQLGDARFQLVFFEVISLLAGGHGGDQAFRDASEDGGIQARVACQNSSYRAGRDSP
jgi:hypothetical protein